MDIWNRMKGYLRLFGAFAIAYLCLTRWGGFSDRQSVTLGIGFALCACVLWDFGKYHDRSKFEPFTITFVPQWHQIVKAQQLMSDDEMAVMWKQERLPGFRLLRDELKLTRLSPALWFFHNHSAFRSRLEARYDLEELVVESDKKRPLFFTPKFYFKESSDQHPKYGIVRCIEFGVVTNDSLEKSVHWSDDRSNIPLARLPDAIFNGYYGDDNFTLNSRIKPEDMDALLAHYGWNREENSYDSPLTFDTLSHEFMTVYVDSI